MATVYTQVQFDAMFETMKGNGIRLGKAAADLHRRGDPAAAAREDEVMMLQNLIYTFRDYDVTSELLTDDEIRTAYEMASQIALNWPRP